MLILCLKLVMDILQAEVYRVARRYVHRSHRGFKFSQSPPSVSHSIVSSVIRQHLKLLHDVSPVN